MKRRTLLKSVGFGGATLIGGSSFWLMDNKNDFPETIEALISKIESIRSLTINAIGRWTPFQIINHCAQSVEMSMNGYPQHQSDYFKMTVGRAALAVFSQKKQMFHGLDEPIPGAQELMALGDIDHAINRLIKALINFNHFQSQLAPHFAYGQLTKSEYSIAHILHIKNHFEEIVYG